MSACMFMIGCLSLAEAGLLPADPPLPADATADVVKLKDGTELLGQVVDPSPRGSLLLILRRDWAKDRAGERYRRWQESQRTEATRAAQQRKKRLEAWRLERAAAAEPLDRVVVWIDQELTRLGGQGEAGKESTLIRMTIPRSEVVNITRRSEVAARLLREAWRLGFGSPETMSRASLEDGLRDRGLDPASDHPMSVDDLLPLASESDALWMARRAATEVSLEPTLRYVVVAGNLMPDPGRELPMPMMPPLGFGLGGMNRGLETMPQAAISDRLNTLVPGDRVGAVVSRQTTLPRMDGATAEVTLWVRKPRGGWAPHGTSAVSVKEADLKPEEKRNAGNGAGSGAFQMAFSFSSSTNFNGQTQQQSIQSSPYLGVMMTKALRQSKSAFDRELGRLTLVKP
ncbi:MAG: hypothetical protein U0794_16025 [Isosphaeraceae bacterium]